MNRRVGTGERTLIKYGGETVKDSSVCCHNRIKYVSNEVYSFFDIVPGSGDFCWERRPSFSHLLLWLNEVFFVRV